MATFLSGPWTGARSAIPGERRFAERLRALLEDDYLCWFDVHRPAPPAPGLPPYYSEVDEARLLYVAMTRATHELVITSCRSSVFSERLQRLCGPLAA